MSFSFDNPLYIGDRDAAMKADVSQLKQDVGDLSQLDTADKSSLVNALNEAIDSTLNGASRDLDNLSDVGDQKLRSLNAYANEGELLTDAEGLADIKNYAYSTFDASKFTVVGSPNITDDGVASAFSGNAIIQLPTNSLINLQKPYRITFSFTYTASASEQYVVAFGGHLYASIRTSGVLFISSGTSSWTASMINFTYSLSQNENYDVEIVFNGSKYVVNINGVQEYSKDTTDVVANANLNCYIGNYINSSNGLAGSIDLKQFSITVDGVEVFSGNKTGVDTIKPDDYTIATTIFAYEYDNHTIYSDAIPVNSYPAIVPKYLYNQDGSYYTGSDFTITDGKIYYGENLCTYNSNHNKSFTTLVDASANITDDGIWSTKSGVGNTIRTEVNDLGEDYELHLSWTSVGEILGERYYVMDTYGVEGLISLQMDDYKQIIAIFQLKNENNQKVDVRPTVTQVPKAVGTNYDVIVGRKGSNCYVKVYANGQYIGEDSKTTTYPSYNSSSKISLGQYSSTYSRPAPIVIDLNRIKFYKNDNLIYQPCLKIPYTESKTGSKIVNSIYRDRVNDMANQFGYANYYTLQDENKGNYVVVGSPTISSDFVASGFAGGTTADSKYVQANITQGSVSDIEFDLEFTTGSTLGQVLYIMDSKTNYNNSFWVNVRAENSVRFGLTYTDGTTTTCTTSANFVQPNTTYKLKCKLSNNTLSISVNEGTPITANVSGTIRWFNKINLGLFEESSNSMLSPFNGSIDLKKFKVYVDNKLAYEAVTEPNFTLPQVELYGLIGQRTLRDSYRNGINYWELYSNRDLEQGGSCTSGVEVTFARPFADTNYVLSVPYSAKSSTAFTPTQTGDWIAKGKGIL